MPIMLGFDLSNESVAPYQRQPHYHLRQRLSLGCGAPSNRFRLRSEHSNSLRSLVLPTLLFCHLLPSYFAKNHLLTMIGRVLISARPARFPFKDYPPRLDVVLTTLRI